MKISSSVLVVVAALATPFVSGCSDTKSCDPGFEREAGACVDSRQKFVGTWTVMDDCSASGTAGYLVTVALSPTDANTVLISHFWASFVAPVRATLAGDVLTAGRQEPDNDDFFVQGSGTRGATGAMTWSYTVTDESDPSAIVSDVCTATWSK